MSVIARPPSLKLAASALWLALPLMGLNTALFMQTPWWRLPWSAMAISAALLGLIWIPLSIGILQGVRWCLPVLATIGMVWFLVDIGAALILRSTLLGFFSIIVTGYFVAVLMWLDHELDRAFLSPRMAWYQRRPKTIPMLKCFVSFSPDAQEELRYGVGRIDEQGVFIFADAQQTYALAPKSGTIKLRFNFRERELRCAAQLSRKIDYAWGLGLRFVNMNPDQRKSLGDFVENLRGEGHA